MLIERGRYNGRLDKYWKGALEIGSRRLLCIEGGFFKKVIGGAESGLGVLGFQGFHIMQVLHLGFFQHNKNGLRFQVFAVFT